MIYKSIEAELIKTIQEAGGSFDRMLADRDVLVVLFKNASGNWGNKVIPLRVDERRQAFQLLAKNAAD